MPFFEKPVTICRATRCNFKEDLKTYQNRCESLKCQVARLLSVAVRRTDDMLASCYGTLYIHLCAATRTQFNVTGQQTGNITRLTTLIKAIYSALTYIVHKFTLYGYEQIRSSVETLIVILMQDVVHLLSHFLRYFNVSLFTAFSSSLFLFFFISFSIFIYFYFISLSVLSVPYFPLRFFYFFLRSVFQASFHPFSLASFVLCSPFYDLN